MTKKEGRKENREEAREARKRQINNGRKEGCETRER